MNTVNSHSLRVACQLFGGSGACVGDGTSKNPDCEIVLFCYRGGARVAQATGCRGGARVRGRVLTYLHYRNGDCVNSIVFEFMCAYVAARINACAR